MLAVLMSKHKAKVNLTALYKNWVRGRPESSF